MTDGSFPQLPCFLHFKREMAIVFILLGGLNLCLGIWLLRLGQFNITLILSIPFTLMGLRFLTKPAASVHLDQVILYNLLGNKVKSYPLSAFCDLRLEGNKLYINQGDTRTKVNLAPSMIHIQDMQKLKTILEPHLQLQAK